MYREKLLSSFNLPQNALKGCNKEHNKGISGFFANESDWLKLEDGDYMVAIGWKANDLNNFIKAASALLYDINSSDQENELITDKGEGVGETERNGGTI